MPGCPNHRSCFFLCCPPVSKREEDTEPPWEHVSPRPPSSSRPSWVIVAVDPRTSRWARLRALATPGQLIVVSEALGGHGARPMLCRWVVEAGVVQSAITVVDARVARRVAVVAADSAAVVAAHARRAIGIRTAIGIDSAVARHALVAAVDIRRIVAGAGLRCRTGAVARAGVIGAAAAICRNGCQCVAAPVDAGDAITVRAAWIGNGWGARRIRRRAHAHRAVPGRRRAQACRVVRSVIQRHRSRSLRRGVRRSAASAVGDALIRGAGAGGFKGYPAASSDRKEESGHHAEQVSHCHSLASLPSGTREARRVPACRTAFAAQFSATRPLAE
jgi:hypothetical protein